MPRFKSYNYQQTEFIALHFEEQLLPGTFEHAIHYLIDHKIDLSCFRARYNNDVTGASAYDPAILLKIILYAYSKGITSSREIQWCCDFNIIFKALSCNTVPHFTTIAAFISDQPKNIENLFTQVLLVCYKEGLLGNELFAIDGCKMSSDASKEWSGTHKELQEKRDKLKRLIRHQMDKHQQCDQTSEMDQEKQQRLQQQIDTLDANCKKIDEFLAASEPRIGEGKSKKEVKSNITDNDLPLLLHCRHTIHPCI